MLSFILMFWKHFNIILIKNAINNDSRCLLSVYLDSAVLHRGANWPWGMSFYSVNGNWRVWQLGQWYRGVLHCWFLLLSVTPHGQKYLKVFSRKCWILQSLYCTQFSSFSSKTSLNRTAGCQCHNWTLNKSGKGLPCAKLHSGVTQAPRESWSMENVTGQIFRQTITYISKYVLVINKHSDYPIWVATCWQWNL